MAKRKSKSKRPQPQRKKQKKSQHDKHERLQRKNANRKKTKQAKVPLTGRMRDAVAPLAACLDRRIAFRLAIIISGMLLADDRRTASAWFVSAGVQDDWDRFYACLFDLPPEGSHGNRIYGKNKISLAKRAGHHQGWSTITYQCRGVEVTRQYKTFLATSRLVSGKIRLVIVRFEDGGWAPYFCTDTSAEVRDILETVAARWAIEEHFHDVKEVWGAGQQQVRNVWSNIACWHLNQWVYTLVELCCWDMDKSELSDRSDRPWDNAHRRPSHADRRRSISREMLQKQFLAALPHGRNLRKLRTLFQDLVAIVA